jgi:FkbM family methyltransferase
VGCFELPNGTKIILDPTDYFQCMMYYGRYCPEILAIFRRFVKPGQTVIDVGAQVGYFSVFLAELVGASGCVCSFEPDPKPRSWLERSKEINSMNWLRILPLALSSSSGEIDFYISQQVGWSTAVAGTHLRDLSTVRVQAASYDSLAKAELVPRSVDFIKIDVEGSEVRVLRGMERTLRENRPVLVMEVNEATLSAAGESPVSLIDTARSLGYSVHHIQTRKYGQMPKLKSVPVGDAVVGDVVCLPMERNVELL